MPKLSRMLGETAELSIDVPGDEPLVVTYRRAALSPRMQARLADLSRRTPEDPPTGAEILALCDLYASLIVAWNLTDDDGEPIATDAESLADVDAATLNLVLTEIGRAVNPDPLSGNGSSNGSSPTASSGPRLITTAS
jgi:hypothetical protein